MIIYKNYPGDFENELHKWKSPVEEVHVLDPLKVIVDPDILSSQISILVQDAELANKVVVGLSAMELFMASATDAQVKDLCRIILEWDNVKFVLDFQSPNGIPRFKDLYTETALDEWAIHSPYIGEMTYTP